MQPTPDNRRHADGSIDFDFYRQRAMRLRGLAMRMHVRRCLAVGGRIMSASVSIIAKAVIMSWRPGRRRLLARASASAGLAWCDARARTPVAGRSVGGRGD